MHRPRFAALACFVVLLLLVSEAMAARGKPRVKFHPDWEKHPSTRYTAMAAAACIAELTQRRIDFTPVKRAPGVQTPVRLPKGVGGVVYRTEIAAHLRANSPYDVFDCRLVLALDDFSKVLRAHDIDEVLIFSAWRPPGKQWPEGRAGTRHPGGLAIDAYRFSKKTVLGQTTRESLDVLKDFHEAVGAAPCGSSAAPPSPSTKEARELRSIVCEAADQHLFTAILTPNYNRAHKNHFHLEVTPLVRWHLVR